MGGGGDVAEQIAKYEARVAAEGDVLSMRRRVYSEVRSIFAPFLADGPHLES